MSANCTIIRIPGIFTYRFLPASCVLVKDRQYLLSANVLDIVLSQSKGMMLVSLDNVHAPLSMKRPISHPLPPLISAFQLQVNHQDEDWQYDWIEYNRPGSAAESVQPSSFDDMASKLEHTLQSDDVLHDIEVEEPTKAKELYSSLGEFLYGLENLRKKTQGDGEAQQAGGITGIGDGEM